jgi:CelD/BcsL family acetyltransferase involved in cellulose biosynthesis
VLSWLQTFRPSHPFFIAVFHDSALVALAPLLIYEKDSESVLAFAAGGVSDYLDILVDPAFSEEGVAAILDAIHGHFGVWTKLELTDLPQSSVFLSHAELEIEPHDTCVVLRFQSTPGDLSSVVPVHKLRNYRNARRRLSEAGEFHVDVATGEHAFEALDWLFRLHAKRWALNREEGVLAKEDVRRFHKQVVSLLINSSVVRIYCLYLNGKVIAVLYSFFETHTAYCYLQGFDPNFSRLSPGTFILGAVIEDAFRQGKMRIDFLRGREPYKYSWGAADVPTFKGSRAA